MPSKHLDGATRGRPQNMQDKKIPSLNHLVKTTPGLTQNSLDIGKAVQKYCNDINPDKYIKLPSPQNANIYSLKAVLYDPDVSFVSNNKTMTKSARRQMASMSIRN